MLESGKVNLEGFACGDMEVEEVVRDGAYHAVVIKGIGDGIGYLGATVVQAVIIGSFVFLFTAVLSHIVCVA